jgi:Domain of unknown function (DUF4159)
MIKLPRSVLLGAAFLIGTGVFAQRGFRRGRPSGSLDDPRAAQQSEQGIETPQWTNAAGFERDVFTFVRIHYGGGYGGRWLTDWPDADLNLAYRLQQMTSMKVDPSGKILELTNPEIFRYPFIYIVEAGSLTFADDEVPILRRYLLNGGFLMVDDFWGDEEWDNFAREIKRVFPDREIVDLPRTHQIFHGVFDLPNDLNLQCPSIDWGTRSQYTGVTWEPNHYGDSKTLHFRGIFDDKGRLCVMICHNTDNGDGWEREGEDPYYFREFSEKKAYPLTINIIFYAMTH